MEEVKGDFRLPSRAMSDEERLRFEAQRLVCRWERDGAWAVKVFLVAADILSAKLRGAQPRPVNEVLGRSPDKKKKSTGRSPRKRKLTRDQILKVRDLADCGVPSKLIAERVGTSYWMVWAIVKGRIHKDVR